MCLIFGLIYLIQLSGCIILKLHIMNPDVIFFSKCHTISSLAQKVPGEGVEKPDGLDDGLVPGARVSAGQHNLTKSEYFVKNVCKTRQ